jgi:hypothetical protein
MRLPKPKKGGEQERDHQQVGGGRHLRRERAGDDAQLEAAGDAEHVQVGHALELERVGDVQDQVAQQRGRERQADQHRAQQAQHQQAHPRDARGVRGHAAAGERALALHRVRAVGLEVGQVVEHVDAARDHAEQRERGDRQLHARGVEDLTGEEERRHHEEVLDPLVWAHGSQ